jgi:cleavage stimulation factor subunit 2
MSDPGKATELLKAAPQLSYAIFQALILMNLVDSKVLASVVEQTARPAPVNIPPPQPTPQQYGGYQTPQMPNPRMVPPPQQYAPPPPVPQPQAAPQMSQEEMLRQVLAMDQRTIDSLPPTERMQIMQLRQQMGVR